MTGAGPGTTWWSASARTPAPSAGLPPDWRIADFHPAMPEFAANPAYFYRRLQRERLRRMHRHMLSTDPPDHTRLRALVSRAFTPRAVERLRDHIAEVAGALLDALLPRGEMDLVADFAFPLPAIVIAELLGVPPADREQFRAWSNAFIQSMGADATPERRLAGIDAQLALGAYLDRLLDERRRAPAVFSDPDRLDVARHPNPHLAFGRGIHHCLGAPLARLEAGIAFSLLLERLPRPRLANGRRPVWHPATIIRGLRSLPLVFG